MIHEENSGRHTSCMARLLPRKAVKLPENKQPSGTQIRFIELIHEIWALFRIKSLVDSSPGCACRAGIRTVGKPKVMPKATVGMIAQLLSLLSFLLVTKTVFSSMITHQLKLCS